MGFNESNAKMNYCYEAGNKSVIYDFVYDFVNKNQDVLTSGMLSEVSSFLLPPQAFDDGKVRSAEKYDETIQLVRNITMSKNNQKGMVA